MISISSDDALVRCQESVIVCEIERDVNERKRGEEKGIKM
jgi:hypothetical protein